MDKIPCSEPIIALEKPSPGSVEVPVLRVFDGDGFLTRMKRGEFTGNLFDRSEVEVAIRLGFVDAPEMQQPGGPQAREFLRSLIADRTIHVVVLTKMNTWQTVDHYGRVVAVPYLQEKYCGCTFRTSSDALHRTHTFGQSIPVWRNIELEMVLNGWAWVLERYDPDERYTDAQDFARRTKRGIWASGHNIPPWKFKRQKTKINTQQPTLFDFECEESCPKEACNGRLVKRRGKFGNFMGCSNFPDCTFSRSVVARHEAS